MDDSQNDADQALRARRRTAGILGGTLELLLATTVPVSTLPAL